MKDVMLTRLEVNGFKNLIDFSVSFAPFNCIAGLNGVGKSNIFDAIRFLSLLSERSIIEAAMLVRDSESNNPSDIFWTSGVESSSRLTISVEMIVPVEVVDDFGRKATATSTFLRYEIELEIKKAEINSENEAVPAGITLLREELRHINKGEAAKKLHFPMTVKKFRDGVIKNGRKGTGFISTHLDDEGVIEIHLHQDGNGGQPQKIPARFVPKTVVSNTNSFVWPTILAAKREMQSWRFLCLEPSAMRRSNKMHELGTVESNGGRLAAALYKLSQKDRNVFSRVASRLSEIIQTSEVRVDVDSVRQLLTLEVRERSGAFLPARALSDGTLRFLALCIMAEDPSFRGLLCFEEPENGIHPAKMASMLKLLKEIAVDTMESTGEQNPMRQIIIATHSPVMVKLEDPDDLLYADIVKIKTQGGAVASTIRCKALSKSWRTLAKDCDSIDKGAIIAYLNLPANSQISLDIEE